MQCALVKDKMTDDELVNSSSNWIEILSSQKLEADKIHTYLDLSLIHI